MPYFVQIMYNGTLHSQKWSRDLTQDGKPIETVKKVQITEREFRNSSLEKLTARYGIKPE